MLRQHLSKRIIDKRVKSIRAEVVLQEHIDDEHTKQARKLEWELFTDVLLWIKTNGNKESKILADAALQSTDLSFER